MPVLLTLQMSCMQTSCIAPRQFDLDGISGIRIIGPSDLWLWQPNLAEVKSMKVVTLCGGIGTRLREETEFRPKPMVEVGGRPILWHIMKIYAHYGFREFVLCLGYRGNMIKEYFLNYEAMNNDFTITLGGGREIESTATTTNKTSASRWSIRAETMTGGRVKRDRALHRRRHLHGDLRRRAGRYRHRAGCLAVPPRHGRLATVTTVDPSSRSASSISTATASVRRFVEKPQAEGWINAGFFVFQRGVFDYLEAATLASWNTSP